MWRDIILFFKIGGDTIISLNQEEGWEQPGKPHKPKGISITTIKT